MECTHATLAHNPCFSSGKETPGRRDTILTHPHMRDTIAMFFKLALYGHDQGYDRIILG